MKIDQRSGTVVLSRRNLLTLLHKLDVPDSERTICREMGKACVCGDSGEPCIGHPLRVRAEEDEVHYTDRVPGRMCHETERFLKEHQDG